MSTAAVQLCAGPERAPQAPRSEQTGFDGPEDYRRLFWLAQRTVWRVTEDKRQGWCRHVPRDELVAIVKRPGREKDRAGLEGLFCCGKPICPLCGPKIAAERAADIAQAITEWYARGGRIAFSTWTMRHNGAQSLVELLDAMGKAWSSVLQNKTPRALRKAHSIGQILKLETTVGPRAGWHPHKHGLDFLNPGTTDEQAAALDQAGSAAWSGRLERLGYGTADEKGHEWRMLDLGQGHELVADYLAKSAGNELAAAGTKRARGENRTPLEILIDLGKLGLESDRQLWLEYERAMKGKRSLRWSPGLRSRLIGEQLPELTDQEAAENTDGASRLIATVGLDTYRRVCRWKGTPYSLIQWAEVYDDDQAAADLIARQLARYDLGHLEAGPEPAQDADSRCATEGWRVVRRSEGLQASAEAST